jgi:hypothetical protein
MFFVGIRMLGHRLLADVHQTGTAWTNCLLRAKTWTMIMTIPTIMNITVVSTCIGSAFGVKSGVESLMARNGVIPVGLGRARGSEWRASGARFCVEERKQRCVGVMIMVSRRTYWI